MLLIPPLPPHPPLHGIPPSLSIFRLFPWKLFAFDTDPLRRGVSHSIWLLLQGSTVIFIRKLRRDYCEIIVPNSLVLQLINCGSAGRTSVEITEYSSTLSHEKALFDRVTGQHADGRLVSDGRAHHNECFAISIDLTWTATALISLIH